MDVVGLLEGLTIWHWVGLGIVLLAIEVAVGTFDLLWIALGAFVTALFALLVPEPLGGWQGQLVCFGAVAIVFVILGRTVFKGLRRRSSTHPNLNDRITAMIGEQGKADTAFDGGRGKVRVGDTVWLAEQTEDGAIAAGDDVVISGAEGTTLKVRRV